MMSGRTTRKDRPLRAPPEDKIPQARLASSDRLAPQAIRPNRSETQRGWQGACHQHWVRLPPLQVCRTLRLRLGVWKPRRQRARSVPLRRLSLHRPWARFQAAVGRLG